MKVCLRITDHGSRTARDAKAKKVFTTTWGFGIITHGYGVGGPSDAFTDTLFLVCMLFFTSLTLNTGPKEASCTI
jgi:hypothetical protein